MSANDAGEKNLVNNRCPNCGAVMTPDSSAEGMKCSYCGTTTTVATGNSANGNPNPDFFPFANGNFEKLWEQARNQGGEKYTLRCNGCNSTITSDQKVSACPLCGSTQLTKSSESIPAANGSFPAQTLEKQIQAAVNEWTASPGAHVTRCQTVITNQPGLTGGEYSDTQKAAWGNPREKTDNSTRMVLQVIVLIVLVIIIGWLLAINFLS